MFGWWKQHKQKKRLLDDAKRIAKVLRLLQKCVASLPLKNASKEMTNEYVSLLCDEIDKLLADSGLEQQNGFGICQLTTEKK